MMRVEEVVAAFARSAALDGALGLLPSDAPCFPRDAVAHSLVIHLSPPQRDGDVLARVMTALSAVRELEQLSHSLCGSPVAKHTLWTALLTGDEGARMRLGSWAMDVHALRIEDPEFPRLVLDLSRMALTPELAAALVAWANGSVDPSDVDVVGIVNKEVAPRLVPVTLYLARSRLGVSTLQSLEPLLLPLGGLQTGSTTRFYVAGLDLSDNALGAAEMNELAEMLEQRVTLDALTLNNVMARSLARAALAAFRRLVVAATGTSSLATSSEAKKSLKGVRCLSLARNSFASAHFGALCSALRRPECRLEELCLARTLSVIHPMARENCWRLLALALAGDAGARCLRRIDLSGNPIFPRDIDAYREAVRAPAAALTHRIVTAEPSRWCTLSVDGSSLFDVPDLASERLAFLEQDVVARVGSSPTIALEAIGKSIDGDWVCIVVPGYGLAWSPRQQVHFETSQGDTIEADQPDTSIQELTVNDPIVNELVINELVVAETTQVAVCSLIESVGAGLQLLDLSRNHITPAVLDVILGNCPALQHLEIEGCALMDWEPLCLALDGPLRALLLTANVANNPIGFEAAARMGSVLSGPAPLPALQELRLGGTHLGRRGVEALGRALMVNKQLHLLELTSPSKPHLNSVDVEYQLACWEIERVFDNERLGVTALAVESKLAFLSVVHALEPPLDAGIARLVFEFAAAERRRRLVWR